MPDDVAPDPRKQEVWNFTAGVLRDMADISTIWTAKMLLEMAGRLESGNPAKKEEAKQ